MLESTVPIALQTVRLKAKVKNSIHNSATRHASEVKERSAELACLASRTTLLL